jgi:hypothetical protein
MKHSDQLRALVASGQTASPELLTEVAQRLDDLLDETDRLTLCLHDASVGAKLTARQRGSA